MKYTIYLGRKKEAAVEVNLNNGGPRNPNPTSIPPHVGLGTGDKKKRYKAYLQTTLSDHPKVLNYLAYLHKLGKEKGSLCLIATHKLAKIHMEGVKEFLEENYETLDMILPYLFPGEGYKAPEQAAIQNPENLPPEIQAEMQKQGLMPGMMSMGSAQLPPEDMEQIQRLIAEDQAREAALNTSQG